MPQSFIVKKSKWAGTWRMLFYLLCENKHTNKPKKTKHLTDVPLLSRCKVLQDDCTWCVPGWKHYILSQIPTQHLSPCFLPSFLTFPLFFSNGRMCRQSREDPGGMKGRVPFQSLLFPYCKLCCWVKNMQFSFQIYFNPCLAYWAITYHPISIQIFAFSFILNRTQLRCINR